jgi:hypothetical protein
MDIVIRTASLFFALKLLSSLLALTAKWKLLANGKIRFFLYEKETASRKKKNNHERNVIEILLSLTGMSCGVEL